MPLGNIATYRKFCPFFISLLMLFAFLASPAWALETPATMVITGKIRGNSSLRPQVGDRVLALNKDTGKLEEAGKVHSRAGLFSIIIKKSSAFNETVLLLQLEQHGKRYKLKQKRQQPAEIIFQGGLVPTRVALRLKIITPEGYMPPINNGGTGNNRSIAGTPAAPTPAAILGDLNGDGQLDQADVNIVKDVVAGKISNDQADINADGIINTRDIINIIRLTNKASGT